MYFVELSFYFRVEFEDAHLFVSVKKVCRISSVEGGITQMSEGPIIGGRDEIIQLGKALKFRVIFPKSALKLIKI